MVSKSIALRGPVTAETFLVFRKVYRMPTTISATQIRPLVMSGFSGIKEAQIRITIMPTSSTVGT